MANDRLFIQCRACGAEKMLAKYSPGGGFAFGWLDGDALQAWLDDHTDLGHYAEHDAFDRAEARPFALYQEDEEPIGKWDKDGPKPPKPPKPAPPPGWGSCAVCSQPTPDANGNAVFYGGKRFHIPCWTAHQEVIGALAVPRPAE